MRATLPLTLLLSALLAACSTKGDIPPSKHIAQSGALRVHPGLLGKPVPPELQPVAPRVAAVPAAAAGEEAIKMDPVGLRTQRSVYFDLNSADIKGDYDPALRAHARYLADHPNARVRIEGNADERGSREYNMGLGERRGNAVSAALQANGGSPTQLTVVSYGEERPVCNESNEDCWAKNRRVELIYTEK